jgi:hypothetical protein
MVLCLERFFLIKRTNSRLKNWLQHFLDPELKKVAIVALGAEEIRSDF